LPRSKAANPEGGSQAGGGDGRGSRSSAQGSRQVQGEQMSLFRNANEKGLPMRRAIITVLMGTLAFSTVGVAFATIVGPPDVQPAGANFALGAQGQPQQNQCQGKGNVPYNEAIGTWVGTSVDTGSAPTKLNGTLTVNAKFEVNGQTGLGVGTGTAKLVNNKGKTVFSGKFTMVTQILNQNNDVAGRGFLNASIKPKGSSLLANFEILLNGQTGGITGNIGGTPSFPDFSTEYNNNTCT
jgi:hypothetical protein